MKIPAIKNINITQKPKNVIKKAKNKLPNKVTVDNLPVVAGTVGMILPIPFASVTFLAIGIAARYVLKKFLHKP